MRRVAVTGIGTVSALGIGLARFWDGLQAGRCGIAAAASPIQGLMAAQVEDHDPSQWLDGMDVRMLDRGTRFGLMAADEAIKDAGLGSEPPSQRMGVVMGLSASPTEEHDRFYHRLFAEGKSRTDPADIPRSMPNAVAGHIARLSGARGPVLTIVSACASSSQAMGEAFLMVRSGRLDVALVGGSDASLSIGNCRGWEALRAMAPDTCRPFSRERKGMVLGEGACVMVIETLERARARGVVPYAELRGYGTYADCENVVKPSREGAIAAMRNALADAGIPPEGIGYINAHGTGTVLNDQTETAAIAEVFGAHAKTLAVSSTKSMHGHTLGAAGAMEAAAALLPLVRGIAPPTMNYLGEDPGCDLNYVPNAAARCEAEAVLSNSMAFGGINAALVFARVGDGLVRT